MTLPKAIICDLDGTLCLFEGKRNPYDASRCDVTDEVNRAVEAVLRWVDSDNERISKPGQYETKIVLMSGRDSKYRAPTERWLEKHKIPYDELHMRAENDRRKDSIVKQELYDAHVKDKYDVLFVLDDRDQVVRVWRDMGLVCFQVNYGDF